MRPQITRSWIRIFTLQVLTDSWGSFHLHYTIIQFTGWSLIILLYIYYGETFILLLTRFFTQKSNKHFLIFPISTNMFMAWGESQWLLSNALYEKTTAQQWLIHSHHKAIIGILFSQCTCTCTFEGSHMFLILFINVALTWLAGLLPYKEY